MKQSFNRRDFIAAAATAAAAPLCAISSAQAHTSKIPSLECDVLVVGAGPAGVPAAIAAARQGAKVILLEEDIVPGGAPVDMGVSLLCGGPRRGIYREMAERLNVTSDFSGKPVEQFDAGAKGGRNYWYLPSAFAQVLLGMLKREPNIRFLGGARAIAATVEEGSRNRVTGVAFDCGGGQARTVRAKVTIDSTGTGLIAALAGCETMYGREARSKFNEPFGPDTADSVVQRCTWMYVSQRLRPDAALPLNKIRGGGMVEHNLDHWVGVKWQGKSDDYAGRNAGIYLHWGANLLCDDTRDPVAIGQASQKAMEFMAPDLAALREAGFVVHLSPKLGVRECRRVVGDYLLTVNDLKSGKLPADVIAVTDGGLDIHQTPPLTEEQVRMPRAGIPYRSLIPRGAEGLLVACKSFSCTHYALGGCRVQPVMAGIGSAAGVAAALASAKNTGVRNISLAELQKQLRQMGALEQEEHA
jgi:hypothetical protein